MWRPRGEALNFAIYPWLVKLYLDMSPFWVCMKAGQVGLSELLAALAIYIPDQLKANSIYFMPAKEQMNDFVQSRIDPILFNADDDYFLNRVGKQPVDRKGVAKVGLKKLKYGFAAFRGGQNPRQVTSFDADLAIIDELDRMLKSIVPYVDKRLLHSLLKLKRFASTPTFPHSGIHAWYLGGTQEEWEIRCPHCRQYASMTLESVDTDNKRLICRLCYAPMPTPWLLPGKWVAGVPDAPYPSYHLCGLYSPHLDLETDVFNALESHDESVLEQFYNQVLGLPYTPKDATITAEILDACKKEFTAPAIAKGCFLGADIGRVINVRIYDPNKRAVFIGIVDNWFGEANSLEALMGEYEVDIAVVDAMPEIRNAEAFCDMFPGRAFRCRYINIGAEHPKTKWDFDAGTVLADRTRTLDHMFALYRMRKVALPLNASEIKDFYPQMMAPARLIETDAAGNKKAIYSEGNAPDHYAHADNYAVMAMEADLPRPDIDWI